MGGLVCMGLAEQRLEGEKGIRQRGRPDRHPRQEPPDLFKEHKARADRDWGVNPPSL